jgi:hypothetical protein
MRRCRVQNIRNHWRQAACLAILILRLSSAGWAEHKLTVSPTNPKQLRNSSLHFTATLNRHETNEHVRWRSSNPAVATIDGAGNATLHSAGTTIITARLGEGEQRASTLLTVTTATNPVFIVQPNDTDVSAVIGSGTGVQVQLLDNLGGPLSGQQITMSIGANPQGSGVLSGTLVQTTDATGTASFADLQIDWLGDGYTLLATASPISGAVSAASASFNELRVGDPCLGPDKPVCSSGCPNVSGDGLNDAWKIAGGIDLNGDGKVDAQRDFLFPLRAQHQFSDVSFTGSGNLQMFPTVTDATLPIATSNVAVRLVTSGGPSGVLGVATFVYSVNGGPEAGPFIVAPVVDVGQNLRLLFYQGNGLVPDIGDTYAFSMTMGPEVKVLDVNTPAILVQYDYMDYDLPGAACSVNSDCYAGGVQPNNVCHAGACTHNHYPGDPLFRKVVDQFAAHGITLYIDPVHHAVPHARVMTWSRPGDGSSPPGWKAACAGADVVAGNIGPGQLAVSFHDIKNRPGSEFAVQPFRKSIYHYSVLGHYNTCFTATPGDGFCSVCPADRATPGGQAQPGASGLAEIPGNDFMISLGDVLTNGGGSTPTDPFIEQGVFMHELGHNLGLHHAGDTGSPTLMPNYLSVMNYNYALIGIMHAAAPGGTVPVEALREVNYSEHTLNALVENNLDENAGVSSLSSGYTGIITFYNGQNSYTLGPEAGPVDWSGNGIIDSSPVTADLNQVGGNGETMPGYRDWDHDAVAGGACTTSADCRVNFIRQLLHGSGGPDGSPDPSIDPHEPCVHGRCQSLWLPSQCTKWSTKD